MGYGSRLILVLSRVVFVGQLASGNARHRLEMVRSRHRRCHCRCRVEVDAVLYSAGTPKFHPAAHPSAQSRPRDAERTHVSVTVGPLLYSVSIFLAKMRCGTESAG